MNPKHYVSLEIAKQLKEAGYPQEGEFWWTSYYEDSFGTFRLYEDEEFHLKFKPPIMYTEESKFKSYVAPLATEILEELPRQVILNGWNCVLEIRPYGTQEFEVVYYHPHHFKNEEAYTLPNALAKMWLYLKKEGIER